MDLFDAKAEMKEIAAYQKKARRGLFRRSRLDPFRCEILALYREGARPEQIRIWIRRKKRVSVVHSTVCRWLRRNHAERKAEV